MGLETPSAGGILVEARNVSKNFASSGARNLFMNSRSGQSASVHAVRDASLTIREGETFGLIGESGSGKSTLGYIVARILSPDGGTVHWNGNVQIIFQEPGGALNPAYNVNWMFHEALRARKAGGRAERARVVSRTLPRVGLDEQCLGRYPHELSGGQKQRVSIMLALLMEPRLIVADEIVSSLDVSARAQILNLLIELQSALRLSYLFISHDLDIVYYMAHTIAVMYRGEIVEFGPSDEVCNAALHPYTMALMRDARYDAGGAGESAGCADAGDDADEPQGPAGDGCLYAGRCPHARDKCRAGRPAPVAAGANHWAKCVGLN